MSKLAELRIILIGKTGNGKSATGNSILRREAFNHGTSLNAVTERCQTMSNTDIANTVRYTVVDTPGLFDTGVTLAERALEIQRSVEICREPHAFLLIFSAKNRLTNEEICSIDMLRILFGEIMFKHSIVVFTHGNEFETDQEFKKFWTESDYLVKLIELCGNRVVKIENKKGLEVYNSSSDAKFIIEKIRAMSNDGRNVYTYRHLTVHRKVIQEHANEYDYSGTLQDEIKDIVERLGKKLDEGIWNKQLLLGIAIGAGTVGWVGAVAATGVGAGMAGGATAVEGLVAETAVGVGATVLSYSSAVGMTALSAAWSLATKARFW